MKKLLLFGFWLMISVSCFSQTRTHFTLSDTAFETGSAYTACDIHYDLDGHSNILSESYPCLDSVADFMKKHPELIFEIASYTDQRGSDSANMKLSQGRANRVKEYLVDHGIDRYSIAAIGYGEQFPLNPQTKIDAVKGKSEKEKLFAQNRRTEFKILYIYPGCFTMNDSAFQVGDVMRIPVLFELGKAGLRPETMLMLDTVATFLIEHPTLVVEISCHSDSRGSDKYSIKLSDARAHCIFDYLVSKGVSQNNMKYAGYSDKKPIVPETKILAVKSKQGQEELYQLNRRTEITILKCW